MVICSKVVEEDDGRISSGSEYRKAQNIYGKKYKYITLNESFFQGHGVEGMSLSVMKYDICQRETAEATSYYSVVMHECEFACRRILQKLMCREHTLFKNTEIHAHKCTSVQSEVSVCVCVQLCQQVHIYLVALWY